MTTLTHDTLKHIAKLSKLSLSDSELDAVGDKLNKTMDLIDKMNEANTSAVAPLPQPLEQSQPLREDVVTETNRRDEFQKIAPATADGFYLVPQVIE